MERIGLFAGLLVGLAPGGCATSVEDACRDLASARCDHHASCSPSHLAVTWGDADTCLARVSSRCAALPDLDGVTIGVADLDACAAAYAHHPCDDLLLDAPPAACRFTGERPNGASCAAGAQCQSSSCKIAEGDACGSCAAVRKAGTTCSKAGSPCDAGTHCGPEERCTEPGGLGEECSAALPCGPRFSCVSGRCEAPAAPGQPCDAEQRCDPLDGTFCSAISGVCEAQQIARAGDPCDAAEPGQIVCAAGTCEDGQCVARPAPDAAPDCP